VAIAKLIPSAISVEAEHGEERGIDSPLLLRAQTPDEIAQAPHIHCSHLLHQHLRAMAIDLDSRPERCTRALCEVGAIKTTDLGSRASD